MRSLLVLAMLTACGGAPPVSQRASEIPSVPRAKCDELVEHVIDLAWLAEAQVETKDHGSVGTWNDGYAEDRHEYKRALRAAQGPRLARRCSVSTIAHVDCALAAETLDAVGACDTSLIISDAGYEPAEPAVEIEMEPPRQ